MLFSSVFQIWSPGGFGFEGDDDGDVYAHFSSLRVSLLVEKWCSDGKAIRGAEDMIIEGPAVRSLVAY